MLPLLFVLTVIATSLHVACNVSHEVTWFTYYLGTMAGLFVSSIILEIWNKQVKKREKLAFPHYEI